MKIIWKENPLHTVVELDELDKKELWYRIKIEELTTTILSAEFDLKDNRIDDAKKELDQKYFFPVEGKSELDQLIDQLHEAFVGDLQSSHAGDCVCFPCTCIKCCAERLLGINTIKGLGKHEANKIDGAFGENRSISEAIEYLRTNQSEKNADIDPSSWKHTNPELWAASQPRWNKERERALAWLIKYKEEHFP